MFEFTKLGDIATLTVGYVGNMTQEYTESGVPFLRSLNIKPFHISESDIRYISEAFNMKIKKSVLREDDVVIVRTGIPGTCCVVPKEYDGCNCSDIVIVHPDKTKVNPDYLAAYINVWGQKQISNNKVGAIQQHFNVRTAEGMLIALPPLKEQKKIAEIIKNINDKIFLNQRINDNLEEQLQILFDYWFKQFDFPNENNEPYKRSGGKMYWDSVYKRNIPTGWEILKFDDLVATPPKTPSIMAPDYKNIGLYPIIDQASSYITGRTDDIFYVYPNEDDCVVFGDVTKVFKYINFPFAKGTDGTKIIRSINNRIPALILYYLIKDAKLPNKGFARYYSLLREIYVLVPSSDVSEKFIVATKPIVSKIRANLEENYKLQITRDWLLPMLMNGQATIDD